MLQQIDWESIQETLKIFKANDLTELRILNGKNTDSGYFLDTDNLIKCLRKHSNKTVYFTLNAIDPACYSRKQCEQLVPYCNMTTKDNDIVAYKWIFIDADPKRLSGVSSTDEEKEQARLVMRKIYSYLRDIGFAYPVVADSGNGYHLLYRVELFNKSENVALVKAFLQTISILFSTETVDIDTAVFNPARITKLYGCMATKGANTKDRPHRLSRILHVPDEITRSSKVLLEKVINSLPREVEDTTKKNNKQYSNGEKFDLEDFFKRHNIAVTKVNTGSSNYTKYILDECVFDNSHKSPDSAIFQFSNGAIGYKCFHNSCADKTWKDVRILFEPDAYKSPYKTYEKKDSYENYTKKIITNTTTEFLKSNSIQANVDESDFIQMKDILPEDRSKIVYIKSGIKVIDKKITGFRKGEVSVWSGSNGSGKSTLLSQTAIQAIDDGYKVGIFSGELTPQRVKQWLHLQCAGRQFVKKWENSEAYYVPYETQNKIDEWINDSLYLYRNSKGLKVDEVFNKFEKIIRDKKIDVIILDNLMAFDLGNSYDKYDNQTLTIKYLSQMAKNLDVHIHFVCHPRKVLSFLRKNDIAGTADITNMADNVFIVHRVNRNFKAGIRAFDSFVADELCNDETGYSNVVEICKNRENGIEDVFVGTHFEVSSKRFLNNKFDNPIYGWQENFKIVDSFFNVEETNEFDALRVL